MSSPTITNYNLSAGKCIPGYSSVDQEHLSLPPSTSEALTLLVSPTSGESSELASSVGPNLYTLLLVAKLYTPLLASFTESGTGPICICKGTESSPRNSKFHTAGSATIWAWGRVVLGKGTFSDKFPLMEWSFLSHNTSPRKGPLDFDPADLFLGIYLVEMPAQRCKNNAQSCSL